MAARQRSELVTLQAPPARLAPTVGPDAPREWVTVASDVWAAVEPISGSERIQAAAIASSVAYRVRIFHRPTVTPTMRVRWKPYGGTVKTLQIHVVTHVELETILECSEIVA